MDLRRNPSSCFNAPIIHTDKISTIVKIYMEQMPKKQMSSLLLSPLVNGRLFRPIAFGRQILQAGARLQPARCPIGAFFACLSASSFFSPTRSALYIRGGKNGSIIGLCFVIERDVYDSSSVSWDAKLGQMAQSLFGYQEERSSPLKP